MRKVMDIAFAEGDRLGVPAKKAAKQEKRGST